MGGKGKVEAPDFGPLAAVMKESADYSYKTAKEQMAWAKQVYNENKGLAQDVIKSSLARARLTEQWAKEDRKTYVEKYKPAMLQQLAKAQDYNTRARQEQAAGEAEANVVAEMKAAQDAASARLEQYGVDPSQLKAGALNLGIELASAQAQVGAGNAARRQTEQYGDALMANAVNAGSGFPQQALAASGASGTAGAQAFNVGTANATLGGNLLGTGPTWQQLGNQGTMGGVQALSAQNQADIATKQANGSSGIGTALGIASSFIPMFGQEGGAIPESGADLAMGTPVPVEASPSGGAIEDDVDAQMPDGGPAKLNAGEFIMPKRTVQWLGEKGLQAIIAKADKEMGLPPQPKAEPETGPPVPNPDVAQAPPVPPNGVGAIPEMEEAA
jgi:hypothetical protein